MEIQQLAAAVKGLSSSISQPLFRNKMFLLDEMTRRNTSKFAIYYIRKPKVAFPFIREKIKQLEMKNGKSNFRFLCIYKIWLEAFRWVMSSSKNFLFLMSATPALVDDGFKLMIIGGQSITAMPAFFTTRENAADRCRRRRVLCSKEDHPYSSIGHS